MIQVLIELMDEALHPIPLLHRLLTVARARFPLFWGLCYDVA